MSKVNVARATLAITAARATSTLCRIGRFGGTSLPGKVAMKICPNILDRVSEGVKTVYVLGTNGKSTTTKMTYLLLRQGGLSAFYNKSGANMESGLTTTYINGSSITGKPKYKICVVECDELYFSVMCKILPPEVVVINNLFEDQMDRLGSPEIVRDGFAKTLQGLNTTMVVNTDCEVLLPLLDVKTGHEPIKVCVRNGKAVVDGEEYEVKLSMPGAYNMYNAAAACGVAKHFGVLNEDNIKILSKMVMPFGRMEIFKVGEVQATMNLIKNPAGTNPILDYFKGTGKTYNMLLGINNEVADGQDISWLDDVAFEDKIDIYDKFYLFGTCANDVKDRLIRAGANEEKIIFAKDTDEIINYIKQSEKDFAVFTNYTCMMEVRSAFAKEGLVKEFWKK